MWLENLGETFIINWMVWFFLKKILGWGLAYRFKKTIYFNWRLITLQYCGVFFAIHQHESAMGTHVHPILNATPHPPHPMPLGCPGALALSALLHASNLYWASVLHMVIYIFQCCSHKSSYPRLLPHSPKVFFTAVSLLLSFLYIGSLLPSF